MNETERERKDDQIFNDIKKRTRPFQGKVVVGEATAGEATNWLDTVINDTKIGGV